MWAKSTAPPGDQAGYSLGRTCPQQEVGPKEGSLSDLTDKRIAHKSQRIKTLLEYESIPSAFATGALFNATDAN